MPLLAYRLFNISLMLLLFKLKYLLALAAGFVHISEFPFCEFIVSGYTLCYHSLFSLVILLVDVAFIAICLPLVLA